MSADFLADRRRGAEEAFFARQNERLRLDLQAAAGAVPARQALSEASGIRDEGVLDTLVDLKVGPEGAAALSLIPLVVVAWADGEVAWKERAALLSAAEEAGLGRATSGYAMFERWLDEAPPAALLGQWKISVHALQADMDPGAQDAFGREILGKARAVAEAAGGFLGIGRVSAEEEAVLADLKHTLGF